MASRPRRPRQAAHTKASRTTKRARAATGRKSQQQPEALALGAIAIACGALVLGYTGAFGTVGRGVLAVGHAAIGRAAWVGWVGLALGGLLVLRRPGPESRRRCVGIALGVLGVSTIVAILGPRSQVSAPTAGGVVGGAIAQVLTDLEGRSGALVTSIVVLTVGLAIAGGVRWSDLASRLASRLQRDGHDHPQTARSDTPRQRRGAGELSVIEPRFEELDTRSPEHVSRDFDVIEGQLGEAPEEVRPTEVSLPEARTLGDGREQPAASVARPGTSSWELPRRSLLKRGARAQHDSGELVRRGQVLQAALASHGVSVSVVGMTTGPTVTRYELELAEGVKVARVLALQRDIAYAMASTDVRILAPIPGRSAIGIEVPNRVREVVTLGDVLVDVPAQASVLSVPLGRDIAGRSEVIDLARMPHLLIAGATGAGKSSLVNSLLVALLMRNTPDELRLILIDPKRVELSQYAGLPHLLTQVVVDPKRAAGALAWAVAEMERRYDVLAQWGVRDLDGYRELVRLAGEDATTTDVEQAPEPLPYVLIVIDELNDLMMAAPREVEEAIVRIAQKARAVGVHLVVATQRPSVDVITGLIKTNIPARVAFAVASQTDSRVILDQPGAEKLIGRGDLLVVTADSSQPRRLQAPWVSEQEIAHVVGAWRRQGRALFVPELEQAPAGTRESLGGDDDPLFRDAVRLVVESQSGSTSMLQRRLKVGFARAGRLMDLLEERGIVGPAEGSKARQVLVRPEELDALLTPERHPSGLRDEAPPR